MNGSREMMTLQAETPRRINTSEEGKRKVNARKLSQCLHKHHVNKKQKSLLEDIRNRG